MLEEVNDIPTPGTLMQSDHALLTALIRALEERQIIAPGEVTAMSERIFQEIVEENKQRYQNKMQAGIDKCLAELADPAITEQNRSFRQNLLAFYESELSK